MFVELAPVGKADWPVTGDKNLLVLALACGQRIVTAEALPVTLGAP
jgi:predicted nucleic acid-binding protein